MRPPPPTPCRPLRPIARQVRVQWGRRSRSRGGGDHQHPGQHRGGDLRAERGLRGERRRRRRRAAAEGSLGGRAATPKRLRALCSEEPSGGSRLEGGGGGKRRSYRPCCERREKKKEPRVGVRERIVAGSSGRVSGSGGTAGMAGVDRRPIRLETAGLRGRVFVGQREGSRGCEPWGSSCRSQPHPGRVLPFLPFPLPPPATFFRLFFPFSVFFFLLLFLFLFFVFYFLRFLFSSFILFFFFSSSLRSSLFSFSLMFSSLSYPWDRVLFTI